MFVGIDLGTQSVKVCIFSETGRKISASSHNYDFSVPRQGWAEQEPESWWDATVKALNTAISSYEKAGFHRRELRGVSFSGQMHGLVMLDKRGQTLRPAILHCDQRTVKTIESIYEIVSSDELGGVTYNRLYTGFLLASLVWVRENEPRLYNQISVVLFPKDYIRFRITNELGTEVSDASASGAFDIVRREWAVSALSKLGIDTGIFPKVSESGAQCGYVSCEAAAETGLPEGIPVFFGGGDQPMQALGNGAIYKGTATSNIGTSGQISCFSDFPGFNPLFNTNTFCNVLPNTWYSMGAFMSAGAAHSWFGKKILRHDDFQALDNEIADIPAGSEGLIFLPYIMGERTPHMNPNAKGLLHGLTIQHDYRYCMHAVMEGVCYALRDCMRVLQEQNSVSIETIIASGGGAKSSLWLQMQADILEHPIHVSTCSEAAELGAAILAAAGVGIYSDIPEACRNMSVTLSTPIQPKPANFSVYRDSYEKYRTLYERVNDLF